MGGAARGYDDLVCPSLGQYVSRKAGFESGCYILSMPGRVRHIWHEAMDWLIKVDQGQYWYKEIDGKKWNPGVPPGMTEEDLGLLLLPWWTRP